MLTDELRAALVGVVARAAELGDTFEQEVQVRRAASVGECLVSGDAHGLLSALPLTAREAPRRADRGSAEPGGWPSASARQAELDPAGALRAVWYGYEEGDYREDNRLGEDAWLAALAAALDRAAGVSCDRRVWLTPRDAPAPLRADLTGLAAELADALADAIGAAAAEAALPAPFCVRVSAGSDPEPLLPPRVLLGDERWSRGVAAATAGLWKGVERKSASPAVVTRGSSVRFILRVANTSAVAAHGVRVCDTPPRGFAAVSAPGFRLRGRTVCRSLGTLRPGSRRTLAFTARAGSRAPRRITNTATASARNARTVHARARVSIVGARAPRVTG